MNIFRHGRLLDKFSECQCTMWFYSIILHTCPGSNVLRFLYSTESLFVYTIKNTSMIGDAKEDLKKEIVLGKFPSVRK
jgi:hypothetical protein